MHAFDRRTDRQTDGQTDRRTEISSLRPRCIPCSAVKTVVLLYVPVLDTMRKAHEAELEKERGKFLDLIAKTYCQADMESLQRQHEYVLVY